MIFKFLSSLSHPHVCLFIVPNLRGSFHCLENNLGCQIGCLLFHEETHLAILQNLTIFY